MNDILRFEYLKLKELNKTVVYVKERKLSKEIESWSYNNMNFIVTHSPFQDGGLKIKRSMSGRVIEFLLYIGDENNYFVVDNDVVKIFKDLEFFVYNKMSLKGYLNNKKEFYAIIYNPSYNKFLVDKLNLWYDDYNLGLFLSGNIFKDEKSAKKFAKRINENELNIFEELKKRVNKEFKNVSFK